MNDIERVTPQRGPGLLCPVCQVPLVMSERQNIEIDYCPTCRGVWLDRGELDKIIERSTSERAQSLSTQQALLRRGYDREAPGDSHSDGGRHESHGYRRKSWLKDLFD